MRESHPTHEEQPPLPICPNDEDLLNMQMLEELGRICERAQLIAHSSTPLPNEAWMCTLEELLKNQVNLLARHEEFSVNLRENEILEEFTLFSAFQRQGVTERSSLI